MAQQMKTEERINKRRGTRAEKSSLPATIASGARMAGGERRLQIVRVATSLFSERGFRGTTTKQIAQAANVSEAIIFRHFATKKELYAAILDDKACGADFEETRAAMAKIMATGDDHAVFTTLARQMLQHHEDDQQFMRLLLYSALEGHELFRMFWDRNVRVLAEFLRGYTRERQRQKAFRNLDPKIVVRAFMGMVMHHSLINNLFDKSRDLLDIEHDDAAREFTDILLHGIAVPNTSTQRETRPARVAPVKKKLRK